MRQDAFTITPINDPTELHDLAKLAWSEGHRMVTRLIDEWSAGENRFDQPGERSYVVTINNQVCAVAGLNIDPFMSDDAVGRVRRLYVSSALRRRGIGSAVMQRLVRDATGRFDRLHLRTRDANACAFYEAVGFTPVAGVEHCTHRRSLIG